MQRFSLGIQRFFGILAIICVGWMLYAFMFTPRLGALSSLYRPRYPLEIPGLDWVAMGVAIAIIVLVKCWHVPVKLSDNWINCLFAIELVLYFIALVSFVRWLDYTHAVDDAQVVLNWLHHFKQADPWRDNSWATQYMYSNPQNLFLMLSYRLVEIVFGHSFFALVVVYCLMHIGTLALTMGILRGLGMSSGYAFITMQLYLAMIQITLQAPLIYTDTLALLFITITCYALMRYLNAQGLRSQIIWLILMSMAAMIAYLSKGQSLIVIIALMVFLLMTQSRKRILFAFIPIIVLLVGNLAWRAGVDQVGIYPDQGYGQPNTHYIMMGMSNTPIPDDRRNAKGDWQVGIFSAADQSYSWKLFYQARLSKKAIEKKQLHRYLKRVTRMSPSQFIAALNNKVSVVWGSGDLKTSFSLARGMADANRGIKLFSGKKWGRPVYFVMTVTQLVLYLGIVLAVIKFFNRRDDVVLLGSIFISGYFAFILLWEANPRYAIIIVPIGVMMLGKFFSPVNHQVADTIHKQKFDSKGRVSA